MLIRTSQLSLYILLLFLFATNCKQTHSGHEEMINLLKAIDKKTSSPKNPFCPEARIGFTDSIITVAGSDVSQVLYYKNIKANALLDMGKEEAISLFEEIERNNPHIEMLPQNLALAYLRKGEQLNCISNHAAESCIIPVKGLGVHTNQVGSRKAIELYRKILAKHPDDLESRWLLNIAYMTLGEYPSRVPKEFLIPNIDGDTTYKINAFQDIAADLKVDVKNMAGGAIVEDFDNDGYLDIVTSGWGLAEKMHYFKNDANGTFLDRSDSVGLTGITGGLHMIQADYNNDGYTDILVLRGAWKKEFGNEPNSLLKNNGDGTFTDVTFRSGLLSFHPTQSATWNDFNNDGWLDLFIGNESTPSTFSVQHPCEFYINNQNGTFSEVSRDAQCDITKFVKGVTSGDYDHDGWKDIFISTMDGDKILLKNLGTTGKEIKFKNVSAQAGLEKERGQTFPTWFWDYDNDGWLDIFLCDYTFQKSLAYYEAAEKLNIDAGSAEKMILYRNNHDGTFTNVAKDAGLTTNVFAMGSNFGDIDNDGFLDMYLGSGNPNLRSVVPNKMFKNLGGKKFVEVTSSARVGHLQKGHAVSFADLDNDGDQDIYIDIGGAFYGDTYQNSFFLNPGQNQNNWICLKLEGTKSNRSAIGTQLKLTFKENGMVRSIYRDVNSGGSFGSSPLRREIGIGSANIIDEIEIRWHASGKVQVFKNVKPNQFLKITEGKDKLERVNIKRINWTLPEKLCLPGSIDNKLTSLNR